MTDEPTAPDTSDVASLDLAALLGEVVERLEDMRDASTHLQRLLEAVVAVAAGLELGQTLRRIVQVAADLVQARYGALGVISPAGGLSEFVVVGLDREQLAVLDHPPVGRGVLGLIIDDPRPLRLDDVMVHPLAAGYPPGHPPMHTFLGVPVRVRGEVYGNLYLTEKQDGGHFTAVDEQVVVALAAAAGVAIENARLYAEAQMRASWLRASSEIATSVLRGVGTDDVLALIATRSREAARANLAAIALPSGPDQKMRFVHASGLKAQDIIGRTTDEVPDDETPAMVVPMVTGSRTLGMLLLAIRPDGRTLTSEERVMAQAFADQAALALTLAEAQHEHERLAILEDRDRIGRDLHDLVIQRLFAVGLTLENTSRLAGEGRVADRISAAVDQLDVTIKDIRRTIFELGNPRRAADLRDEINETVSALVPSLGFKPQVRTMGAVHSGVSDEVRAHLLAVLHEALSNVARHALATSVTVVLEVSDQVVLTVADDGRGLRGAPSGNGLRNMHERAEKLGGTCELGPAGDTGTRVVWQVPAR